MESSFPTDQGVLAEKGVWVSIEERVSAEQGVLCPYLTRDLCGTMSHWSQMNNGS